MAFLLSLCGAPWSVALCDSDGHWWFESLCPCFGVTAGSGDKRVVALNVESDRGGVVVVVVEEARSPHFEALHPQNRVKLRGDRRELQIG